MPYLFAPDGGVNRKLKVLYAPSAGINCKQKSLWAPDQGINRKIFSSAIPATLYDTYLSSDSATSTHSTANNTNGNNIGLSVYAYNTDSHGSHSVEFAVRYKLPYTTAISANEQLLSYSTTFAIGTYNNKSCAAGSNYEIGILVSNGNYWFTNRYATTSLISGGNTSYYSQSGVVKASSSISSPGAICLTVSGIISVPSHDYNSISVSLPWPDLIWAPTGEHIALAA